MEEKCRINTFSMQDQCCKKDTQEERLQGLQKYAGYGPTAEKIQEMDATKEE